MLRRNHNEKRNFSTTTEKIPGQEYIVLGEVFGLTTQSKDIFRNIGAGLKNIIGGEIKDYTKMLDESRNIAVDRLRENAMKMGADAVVMMRFDSGSIGTDMQSVAAYGTAVKFK
ncbi:heavy metal-binding domain-containing protein [Pediococcus pentosaceus]|uniref:heavy metal-binding domain-containing protein n=1 Tax=Pediococcus pentosaceus TaxID=1255 RepID=UPI0013304A61|nr:heavy metal-binding domain-containing protein [Pediococcus pentosaceus]KAF0349723.1 heavy metal-binding domain-containing protein [Pediococcus pentosaceus]MBF7105726.1 heavy metal-binding domain-containing protein [Pediococcus pentosaceus]